LYKDDEERYDKIRRWWLSEVSEERRFNYEN